MNLTSANAAVVQHEWRMRTWKGRAGTAVTRRESAELACADVTSVDGVDGERDERGGDMGEYEYERGQR